MLRPWRAVAVTLSLAAMVVTLTDPVNLSGVPEIVRALLAGASVYVGTWFAEGAVSAVRSVRRQRKL